MTEWSEPLPDQCPPDTAFDTDGFIFYRLCETDTPTENDFKSQRHISPNKPFKYSNGEDISECILRSLSVWDNIDSCLNLMKLPRNKGKLTMKLELITSDGRALNTFKPKHYSWWRTKSFDITRVRTIK